MSITAQYDEQFGNLDEVYPPAIWDHPAFADLARAALDRGTPLTLAEVQRTLPEAVFETLED